jgi:hypothetical protein
MSIACLLTRLHAALLLHNRMSKGITGTLIESRPIKRRYLDRKQWAQGESKQVAKRKEPKTKRE